MVSTAQLSFSCPQPPARRSAEPPVGAGAATGAGAPRAERSGAERSLAPAAPPPPPSRVSSPSAAAGPGAAGSFSRDPVPGAAAAPKLFPAPRRVARVRGGARGSRAGPSGARGRHQVLPGARSLFHFSFTCFTEVGFLSCRRSGPALPGPAEAGGEVSRGLRSAGSFPAARRPPRAGPGWGGGRAAGRGAGWPGEDAEGKFMGVLK